MSEAAKGTIRQVAIADLTPHPDNYRSHDEQEITLVMRSLETHGQYRTIPVQAVSDDGTRHNTIGAGHCVTLAAGRLGWKSLDCTVLKCTDDELRRILVDDNFLADYAADDRTMLADLIADCEVRPYSFDDDAKLEDLLAEITMPRMSESPEEKSGEPEGPRMVKCPECGAEVPVRKQQAARLGEDGG